MSIDFAPAATGPDRVGQGTAIEQSRAVASIQAMVVLARQFPRDEKVAKARMVEACRQPDLAEAGFYNYSRGGKAVTGMTIGAVVEIARCWGNLDYGLTEMRRDDVYGQSEMLAHCWELETNVADRHAFIVQHVRGRERLKDPRDVYELNTNEGNRRLREAILKQLPRWYRVLAEKTLRDTLRAMASSEKPVGEQIDGAVAWFAAEFGVALDQLEDQRGAQMRRWGIDDVIELRILGNSLKRGEVKVDDVFPSARVTAEELAQDAAAAAAQASAEPVQTAAAERPAHTHQDGEFHEGCDACELERAEADQAFADGAEGGA